jgi:hypothetical protein
MTSRLKNSVNTSIALCNAALDANRFIGTDSTLQYEGVEYPVGEKFRYLES